MCKSDGIKITLFSVLFTAGFLSDSAQNTGEPLRSREPHNPLAKMYQTGREFQMKLALQLAAEKQWPVFRTLPGGGVLQLERVDKLGLPVYVLSGTNIRSAATTLTDPVWPGGSSGLNLRGSYPFVESRLSIWDGGALRAGPRGFGGRI